jgi:hypothetical protein
MGGETLGILVNSDDHFNIVYHLANAAVERGKKVCIHILGEGMAFIGHNKFNYLCRIAKVTICEAGLRASRYEHHVTVPESAIIVSPGYMDTILSRCDRRLSF